jgi:hypothetical protein
MLVAGATFAFAMGDHHLRCLRAPIADRNLETLPEPEMCLLHLK